MGALCCKAEVIDFDGPVDLYHFYLLRAVGKGAFGKVRVVQHKQTKSLYALKYINKAKCIKMRAVSNIIQERRLLEEIESPFICNLRYAFQDDENMFMVLDLMLGGDLRFHLDRSGNMKEDVVRFYVAELALALHYLHRLQIVHRDIKPDNILLDERGHAHLTDFNIAVHFSHRRPLTSIAGSMAYMAPEVLAKKGYLSSVDWWSLGVMAYELLFGRRPYRGKTNSALTHSILNDRCSFPDNVENIVSRHAVSAIQALLERDIKKRLGCQRGIEDFKQHPWFAGMNWEALEAKEATPPFEPDSKKANFDATHELEELLLEDNPLKAKKRDEKRDFNALSPEMRQMEEHFLPFDHLKQTRRSYFRRRRDRDDNDAHTSSQASSVAYTLADQPLADMRGGGGANAINGGASATSSLANAGIPGMGGVPRASVEGGLMGGVAGSPISRERTSSNGFLSAAAASPRMDVAGSGGAAVARTSSSGGVHAMAASEQMSPGSARAGEYTRIQRGGSSNGAHGFENGGGSLNASPSSHQGSRSFSRQQHTGGVGAPGEADIPMEVLHGAALPSSPPATADVAATGAAAKQ